MSEHAFQEKLEKAKKNVSDMDAIDGGDRSVGTIIAALQAGIRNPDSNAQFDALVMLMDIDEFSRSHHSN